MQRLFSTFPNGWPGTGLMLLRCAAAFALISDSVAGFTPAAPGSTLFLPTLGIAVGLLLVAGLWTPVAAIALVTIELGYATQHVWTDHSHTFVAVVGVSLAMLGPGTWSVDASLYGRMRIDL